MFGKVFVAITQSIYLLVPSFQLSALKRGQKSELTINLSLNSIGLNVEQFTFSIDFFVRAMRITFFFSVNNSLFLQISNFQNIFYSVERILVRQLM